MTMVGYPGHSTSSGTHRYWGDLLPALPALRCLTYEVDWPDTRAPLSQLEEPSDGGGGLPCPALGDIALEWHVQHGLDYGLDGDWHALRNRDSCAPLPQYGGAPTPEVDLVRSLEAFCDRLGACLGARAGRCALMRRLAVAPRRSRLGGADDVLEGWQMALVEERLRVRLGDLVEDIAVVDK